MVDDHVPQPVAELGVSFGFPGCKQSFGERKLRGALAFGAALANAELIERGDLFVKFQGGIAPTALPRHADAPISVRVDGTVRSLSKERPPALRFIAIAINRGGRIDTRGLPLCRRSQIEAVSSAQALEACGSALVGKGR